jgi:hypothetical protein
MCIIITGTNQLPSLPELRACEARNPHGAGVAFVNGDGGASWIKGADLGAEDVRRILRDMRPKGAPYVVHFRYATVGAPGDALCHPFPITPEASTEARGVAKQLLFHNGTVPRWSQRFQGCQDYYEAPAPHDEEWSDSRATAYMLAVSQCGHQILNTMDSRFAVISGDGVRRYGDGWVKVRGVWFSNMRWMPSPRPERRHQRLPQGAVLFVDDGADAEVPPSMPRKPKRATTPAQPNKPRRLRQNP